MPEEYCPKCCKPVPKLLGDYILCFAGCKRKYHFGCSVSRNTYNSMTVARKASWKCRGCRTDKAVACQAEDEDQDEDEEEDAAKKDVRAMLSPHQLERNEVSVNKLLSQININVKNLTEEMKEIKNTVNLMSDKYDGLLVEVKELRIVKINYDIMTGKVASLEDRLNELEQESRGKNIEIKGIAEQSGEELKKVVVTLANKLGDALIEEKDIEAVHRVSNMNNKSPKDIIVQFKDRDHRNRMLYRKKGKIYSKDVVGGNCVNQVYINEHLTPYNKQLFWEAKNKSREQNFRFVWIKDGKIFVRRNEKERAYRIRNGDDLGKIV